MTFQSFVLMPYSEEHVAIVASIVVLDVACGSSGCVLWLCAVLWLWLCLWLCVCGCVFVVVVVSL